MKDKIINWSKEGQERTEAQSNKAWPLQQHHQGNHKKLTRLATTQSRKLAPLLDHACGRSLEPPEAWGLKVARHLRKRKKLFEAFRSLEIQPMKRPKDTNQPTLYHARPHSIPYLWQVEVEATIMEMKGIILWGSHMDHYSYSWPTVANTAHCSRYSPLKPI